MANPVSGENEKNISKCRLLKNKQTNKKKKKKKQKKKKKKKKKINKTKQNNNNNKKKKQEDKALAYSIYKEKPSFFKMSLFLTAYKYELLVNNIAVSYSTHA